MRLYLVLLLRLRGKGAEGDDGEDDCQHNEQDRDHCLDVVPDVSAGGKFSGDGLEQGSDRDYQHEAHGDEEHLVVSADIAEPCADSDQAESGEELSEVKKPQMKFRMKLPCAVPPLSLLRRQAEGL